MPLQEDVKIEAPSFQLLPNDVYQVVITDVEKHEGLKYMSTEKQEQLKLKLSVCDPGEFNGSQLMAFSSYKWFDGGTSSSPSKLYAIFQAVYGFYEPKADLQTFEPEMINMDMINGLIGKQMRVTVMQTQKGKNKIESYMKIKEELPLPKSKADGKLDPKEYQG